MATYILGDHAIFMEKDPTGEGSVSYFSTTLNVQTEPQHNSLEKKNLFEFTRLIKNTFRGVALTIPKLKKKKM